LKAEECLAAAETNLELERWNAAGVLAVHAGISLADAALADIAGLRTRDPDHSAIVRLLDERVAGFDGAARRQLSGLLKMKSAVEYEERLLTEVEAVQLVDHARRLNRWLHRVSQAGGAT
jgi:hypothetical protein